jgi:thioesterase domain-containing protein
MPDTPELSASKRALLEKYLRGELPKSGLSTNVITQRAQAAPVPASSTDSRVSLIPVQASGSKTPFFYMHVHWIGGAFYSFVLAHDLGSDQPLYVIDPYKFDNLSVPPTIEAMAAAYITAIRTVQPEGPYLLGGFCAGGLLAYEVSQQLRAAGQTVELVVLIDPMAGPIQSLRLLGTAIRRVGSLIHLEPAKQLDWFLRVRYISRILRRAQDENTEHVNRLLQRWQSEHPGRFSLLPAAEALRQDWMAVFTWAVSGYFPRKYPGKMTYLLAKDNPDRRHLWWGKVAESDQVEVFTIPGTHETCRTEHLHEMTQRLRLCLSKAQASMMKQDL